MEKAKGGQPYQSGGTMGSPKTLKALGISPDQSSRWQALANVPEEDFEAAIADLTTGYSARPVIIQHKDRSRGATGPQTLAELGVSKGQSSRWQALVTGHLLFASPRAA